MSSLPLVLGSIILFILAYRFYGRWLEKKLGIDPSRPTPCRTMSDGVDYVACKPAVLLGHHFASIAGAAPIIGPIAASAYGWLPVLIWVVVGGIFAGAVHDFASLAASLRHRGRSIGVIIEEHVGYFGKVLFLIFALAALVLVIGAFLVIVAQTFVATPAVATSSILFLVLALIFGRMIYRMKMPLFPATVIGVVALFLCVWLGILFPIGGVPSAGEIKGVISDSYQDLMDDTYQGIADIEYAAEIEFAHAKFSGPDTADMTDEERIGAISSEIYNNLIKSQMTTWIILIMIYIFVASVTPVNILLQPRDYLNSFFLYAIIIASLVGLFVVNPKVQIEPFITFNADKLGPLFPILFVTVACGAISGFHSLVASGTTVKQLSNEKYARPITYGAMLIESTLAVIALVVVATMAKSQAAGITGGPIAIFSQGVGGILGQLGIPAKYAMTFTALAVSAFALTSLDTVARVGRFIFQELFAGKGQIAGKQMGVGQRVLTNRYIASIVMIILGGLLALSGQWKAIWPLFGSSNQMMGAIALLAVTMWLVRRKTSSWFVQIPLYFMFAVTLTALVILTKTNLAEHKYVLAGIAIFLLIVTGVLIIEAIRSLIRMHKVAATPER